MTKGQTEFLVAIGVIIFGLGITGFAAYKTYQAVTTPDHTIAYVHPDEPTNTTVLKNLPPSSVVQPTIISVPIENCDVLKSIHIAMTKAEVVKICGNPERIDESSAEVQRVERVFKHDEIWYYDKESETVELTNDIVTAIHPTLPQSLPVIHK